MTGGTVLSRCEGEEFWPGREVWSCIVESIWWSSRVDSKDVFVIDSADLSARAPFQAFLLLSWK
jgi:hypothetical protein